MNNKVLKVLPGFVVIIFGILLAIGPHTIFPVCDAGMMTMKCDMSGAAAVLARTERASRIASVSASDAGGIGCSAAWKRNAHSQTISHRLSAPRLPAQICGSSHPAR